MWASISFHHSYNYIMYRSFIIVNESYVVVTSGEVVVNCDCIAARPSVQAINVKTSSENEEIHLYNNISASIPMGFQLYNSTKVMAVDFYT